jgi:hypothetical protein
MKIIFNHNNKKYQLIWLLLLLSVVSISTFEEKDIVEQENENEYIHEWVAKIPGGNTVADLVAQDLGFINQGNVSFKIIQEYL